MYKYKKLLARIIVTMFIFTNVLFSFSSVFAAPKDKVKNVKKNKVEILVKYRDTEKIAEINNKVKTKLNLKKLDKKSKMKYVPIEIYEIDETDDINKVVEELLADPNVEYAQPNYELFAVDEETKIEIKDPRYKEQWALSNTGQLVDLRAGVPGTDINAYNAWKITEGSDTVVVAVLDTGIDTTHIDLKNNIFVNKGEIPGNGIDDDGNGYIDDVNGWDFVNNDNKVYDSSTLDKHGTHIAGIIAAQSNEAGIRGVAPKVKLLPLKFLNGSSGYTSDAIEAIEYAKMMGAKVVNCSFGGTNNNYALKDAMAAADMLFVCAAGNNGLNTTSNPVYPASFNLPNIVSVAAVDNTGSLASFSNYGQDVHIAAPGVNILSTVPNNSYEMMNGTSMAAPHVTGTAALILSSMADMTGTELANRVKNSAKELEKLKGKVASNGMLDAYKALTITLDSDGNYQEGSRSNTQLLVKLKDASKAEEIKNSIIEKLELTKLDTVKKLGYTQIELWEIAAEDDMNLVVSELMINPHIQYAHPNYELYAFENEDEEEGTEAIEADTVENTENSKAEELAKLEAEVKANIKDGSFAEQWSLDNTGQIIDVSKGIEDIDINVLRVWSVTEGSANTVIGILDTGIDINHEDLAASIKVNKNEIPDNGIDDDENGYIDDVYGWDFANKDNNVFDSNTQDKHGTHIAGIIAAQSNEIGIRGIAPKVKLLPLKFMNGSTGYTSDAIEAIEYAKAMGVKIINISFGSTNSNYALKDVIEASDMLFVCAAGNDGQDTTINPVYPASFDLPNIVTVAAVDNTGSLADFSNYGKKVHLAAPGTDILSTVPGNKYEMLDGTSAAAAHVTGVAALVLGSLSHLTGAELATRLKNSARAVEELTDMVAANGIIDASIAMSMVSVEEEKQIAEDEANAYDAIMVSLAAEISPQLKEQIHYGENGVNPATGNYSTSNTDMSMSAPGFIINISRTYNSKDERANSLMGRGWTFGFEGSLKVDTTNSSFMVAKLPNGSVQVFLKNADGTYTANDSRSKLVKQADNTHVLTTKDQYTYGFGTSGYLLWMKDKKGNAVNIEVNTSNGRILSITDQVGRKFDVAYNAQGFITSVTDPKGRQVKYEYENNLLTRVVDPMGNMTHFAYDADKYLTEIRDNSYTLLESVTYNHAAGENQHKATQLNNKLGNAFNYTYNNTDKKTTITDTNGRQIIKWYDTWLYTIKSEDPEGRQVTVEYYLDGNNINKYGEEKSIKDRNGNTTQYLRDNNGNITKIINSDGSSREYVYDEKNNLTMEKDEVGNKTYYVYDESKLFLLKKVQPLNGTDVYNEEAEEEKFAITTYAYYTDEEAAQLGYQMKGMLKSEADPEGNTTTYTYDAYGNTKTVTDPMGYVKTNNYNLIGWLTSTISPSGYKTEFQYNNNGLLEKIIQNNGETRIVYDNLGRKVKEITASQYKAAEDGLNLQPAQHNYDGDKGHRYAYYANGLLKTYKDALGNETTYTYDLYGNKLTETKPNGLQYIFEYDVMNRLKKLSYKNNAQDLEETATVLEEYIYTILQDGKTKKSHIKYLDDTETAATIYTYDFAGRVLETQHPDGTTTSSVYNANGTTNTNTDANGSVTYYRYDGQGRLTESWTPIEADKYSYGKTAYDKAGRVVQQASGKDKIGLYEIPVADRLITQHIEYYANGVQKAKYDEDGRRTTYYYNGEGNLVKEEVYTTEEKFITTEYTYNHMSKPLTKTAYVRSGDIYGYDFAANHVKALTTKFSYDKEGNLIKYTTPDGTSRSYTYDIMNRQTSESYIGQDEYGLPAIVSANTEYSWSGKPVKTTDAKGYETQFVYDKRDRLIKTIKTTTALETVLDEEQNPVEQEVITEYVTAYAYDRGGRRIAEVLPENYDPEKESIFEMNRIQYTYDKMDRIKLKAYIGLLKEFDEAEAIWTDKPVEIVLKAFKYGKKGNVVKELEGESYQNAVGFNSDEKIAAGYGTEYTYNLADQLITVLDPETKDRYLSFTVKYDYDGVGRRTTETSANGAVKRFYYDNTGKVIRTTVKKSANDVEQTLNTVSYDLAGRKLTEADAYGSTVTYEYNSLNSLMKTTTPGDQSIASNTTIFQYDEMGRLKKKQDSMGTVDIFNYDNAGRRISQQQQNTDGGELIKTTAAYDVNGNVRFTTDANGTVTENLYDELNRLVETKTAVSNIYEEKTIHSISYKYDKNGNKTEQTDWRGNNAINVYDQLGRIIERQDSYGTVQKLAYNYNNAQIKSYDAYNNITSFQYDKNNRQLSTTDAEGHTTSQTYDIMGKIATKTDGNGNTTTYEYDFLNRLTTVVNPKYERTSYTFDLNGNKLTQTDGNGNVTIFEYNVLGMVSRIINHGGRTETENGYMYDYSKVERYTYNADKTIKTSTDRNGITTIYTYDSHKRLLSKTAGSQTISYTYDANSNTLTMTDMTGTTGKAYDQFNRVIMKTVPNIGVTTYVYDIISGIEEGMTAERTVDPKGNITVKVYDKAGRLKFVIADGETTTYSYDGNGNRTRVQYHDGSKEEYTFYRNNLLKTLVNTKADGTIIDSYSYTYDNNNNQITKTDSKGITNYTYDSLNRLMKVIEPAGLGGKVTLYTYDKAGNRLTEAVTAGAETTNTTCSYNELNRLMKTLTKKPDGVEETTKYTYDSNGNMIYKEVEKLKPAEETVIPTFSMFIIGETENELGTFGAIFKYDEFNQLVSTTSGTSTATYQYNGEGYRVAKTKDGQTTKYLYEYDKVVLELDGNGNQIAKNVYGLNLVSRTVEGEKLYYFYNGHADVTALMDSVGNIKATYYYDAFGNPVEETGVANNPYRYSGYQFDEETGNYYLNARYYDPKIARFLTEDTYRGRAYDPLSLNLYTYVLNNPIKYWDPTGHWEEGDSNYSDEQQAAIVKLTNQWFAATTQTEKDKIHAQANAVRNGTLDPSKILGTQVTVDNLKSEVKKILDNPLQGSSSKVELKSSDVGILANNKIDIKTKKELVNQINEQLATVTITTSTIVTKPTTTTVKPTSTIDTTFETPASNTYITSTTVLTEVEKAAIEDAQEMIVEILSKRVDSIIPTTSSIGEYSYGHMYRASYDSVVSSCESTKQIGWGMDVGFNILYSRYMGDTKSIYPQYQALQDITFAAVDAEYPSSIGSDFKNLFDDIFNGDSEKIAKEKMDFFNNTYYNYLIENNTARKQFISELSKMQNRVINIQNDINNAEYQASLLNFMESIKQMNINYKQSYDDVMFILDYIDNRYK